MSSSPFPYTCELCGAEGLTDEGMRTHTLEAHVAGRPDCPFCDCTVPQAQLVSHVQRAHLHYLTPERELMAFIDDQSPSFDDDSKMTTDSCSYNTPGSINGWHSPDTTSSYHNGAISKSSYYNGFLEKDNYHSKSERDDEKFSRSPKNINLTNGLKNVHINNGVIPKKNCSKENSIEREGMSVINGHDKKGIHSSPNHNSNDNSPNKNKLTMASAGQGSPLRSQLALKLKSNTPKKSAPTPSPTVQCLLCEFKSTCPRKLEEHINRAHFDLTSPSVMANANSNSNITENVTLGLSNATLTLENPTLALSAMALSPGPHGSKFQCPICESEFANGSDVEVHVNVEHRDILSPQKSDQTDNASCDDVVMMEESPVSNCPVCCQPLPLSQNELIQHIEEHFERGEDGGAATLTAAEREAQRNREEHEFQLLRAQYGMEEDEEGYTSRAASSLKRAVYSGALSVAGYYERSVGLKKATAQGLDAGCSRTNGILERIAQLNSQNPSIAKTYLCSAVDHYASTYGDRGWGCGYRNMQMVLSSLVRHPPYAALLSGVTERECECVPSIPSLQLLVERAWQLGFDTQGSEQLGCKLHNTRKWIGACEVVTVLSSLRIRCQLIDFHKPTAGDGSHPALFDWVLRYFQNDPNAFKPPLYLQHQGHSRTIIGYERHKDGKATLLVLDPSHSPAQVRQVVCGSASSSATALRLLRRGASALRAKQYQLLCVNGVMASDTEYQASKVLQSVRIP
ncbi:zinc finger-containing ubiquitin peptidase 1-like [Pararge aegeria]|uniref:zinc finger-containing ubiquitin peptidase 1-like n=1 Tax=Pararge aegeria TaxID=116150 RepID=UPI0019D24E5D|nr:zinc finger-containing ubiquitin peptidase 1-like [Pararge aegeria]XP_039756754.1 zinc finger-containing ubiquitin peptidase 1-like [Pararge aegeria]